MFNSHALLFVYLAKTTTKPMTANKEEVNVGLEPTLVSI